MTRECSTLRTETGHRLQRYLFRPRGKPQGGVLMLHGLGDYLERYEHLARFFCEHGLLALGMDLPGHGRSSGRRGHIPGGFEFLRNLMDREIGELRAELPESAPLGLFAHSMGAYVALDYLPDRPGIFRFAWLSSPLFRPDRGKPAWLLWAAEHLTPLLPGLQIDTGVRAGDCRPGVYKDDDAELFHHWVSAEFGRELMRRQARIAEGLKRFPEGTDLLITHGTADPVCPLEDAETIYAAVPGRRKAILKVEGALHEPLHGPESAALLQSAARWMQDTCLA